MNRPLTPIGTLAVDSPVMDDGDLVPLGPLRPDVAPLYRRWSDDPAVMSSTTGVVLPLTVDIATTTVRASEVQRETRRSSSSASERSGGARPVAGSASAGGT